jgi:hypothetical protein
MGAGVETLSNKTEIWWTTGQPFGSVMTPSQENLVPESKLDRQRVTPISRITTPSQVAISHRAIEVLGNC